MCDFTHVQVQGVKREVGQRGAGPLFNATNQKLAETKAKAVAGVGRASIS